jgi:hypothetical protein
MNQIIQNWNQNENELINLKYQLEWNYKHSIIKNPITKKKKKKTHVNIKYLTLIKKHIRYN